MPDRADRTVTEMLEAAGAGDTRALDQLFDRVYAELKGLAHQVREGRAGETLNTTALVHEAYLKLVGASEVAWNDRAHFFAIAGRVMRQILVDAARRRMAAKRGSEPTPVTFDDAAFATPLRSDLLVALDEALVRLSAIDPRRAQVVELRVFAGQSITETAELLGVSTGTIERDWRAARAFLSLEMANDSNGEPRDGDSH
jgi:RNA polymerase sigma factor (TIGR02999 family)